jgi:hypothetical protein
MSIGISRPMTPVEEIAISSEGTSNSLDTKSTKVSQSLKPCSPVKQLALPLLTKTAEITPFSSTFFVYLTGAATTLFEVKTAEAVLFGEKIWLHHIYLHALRIP